jgi:glutamate synthase (NADPH/NADH) small chain
MDGIERNFEEVLPPLSPDEAVVEATRCLFCFDAPCIRACPTHIDIPSFIRKIATGNLRGSARVIMESNPLGATSARVCPVEALCEGGCVYNHQERPPIQIGQLQRHATDWLIESGETTFVPGPANGKSVGCIGSGPSSLAAAVRLREWGYAVTLYEAKPQGGGLDTYGIVSFRLPVEVSLAEVDLVERMGATFRYNTRVGTDITMDELLKTHDALFVGVGLGQPASPGLPGEELPGVRDALPFIEETKSQPLGTLSVGRHVLVIGAGNTAIDAATAAGRLGAESVTIVYRRSEEEIPCYAFEFEFAKQEASASMADRPKIVGAGKVEARCVRPARASRTRRGAAAPRGAGSAFTIPADMIIRPSAGPDSGFWARASTSRAPIVWRPTGRRAPRATEGLRRRRCRRRRDDATVVAVVAMGPRGGRLDKSLGSPRPCAAVPARPKTVIRRSAPR